MIISVLKNEYNISKIYYHRCRNKNQHTNLKYFSFTKKINLSLLL